MSAYEQGKVQPNLSGLERILRALDASLSDLDQELRLVAHTEGGPDGMKAQAKKGVAMTSNPSHGVEIVERRLLSVFEAWLDETRALLRRQLGG